MPRDGTGAMAWPPNTDAVQNNVISSAAYNTRWADLLADLNTDRSRTFDSATALAALPVIGAGSKINVIRTLGNAAPGDGGGGVWALSLRRCRWATAPISLAVMAASGYTCQKTAGLTF